MIVNTPKTPAGYPDCAIDCQIALKPEFDAMMFEAVYAGWS